MDVTAQLLQYAAAAAVLCVEHHAPARGEAPGLQPRTADSKLETVPVSVFFWCYFLFPPLPQPPAVDKHPQKFQNLRLNIARGGKREDGYFFLLLLQRCGLGVCISQDIHE